MVIRSNEIVDLSNVDQPLPDCDPGLGGLIDGRSDKSMFYQGERRGHIFRRKLSRLGITLVEDSQPVKNLPQVVNGENSGCAANEICSTMSNLIATDTFLKKLLRKKLSLLGIVQTEDSHPGMNSTPGGGPRDSRGE